MTTAGPARVLEVQVVITLLLQYLFSPSLFTATDDKFEVTQDTERNIIGILLSQATACRPKPITHRQMVGFQAPGSLTAQEIQFQQFEGASRFRQHLVLSLLSGKALKIDKIRDLEDRPGLQGDNEKERERVLVLTRADFEISFLRLIDKFTNGTKIEISHTGPRVAVVLRSNPQARRWSLCLAVSWVEK